MKTKFAELKEQIGEIVPTKGSEVATASGETGGSGNPQVIDESQVVDESQVIDEFEVIDEDEGDIE